MKILSVNKFYWRKGGSEAVFFNEKTLLESHNHVVVPFSMKGEKNEKSEYSKYFVNEIDYTTKNPLAKVKAATTVLYSFDARKKIKMLLEEFVPDIAHFHIFQHQITPSVFGPLQKLNIPIVLTLHDLKPICPNYKMFSNSKICEACKGQKFYKCFSNKCNKGSSVKSLLSSLEMYLHYQLGYYQNVDRYIAVSKFYQNKMIEFGFPKDKISYLPNCIDTDSIPFSRKDDGYALSFGRLSEEKSIETIIAAAELVPEIPIIIAGTGPSESELWELVKNKNITNIEFVGHKSGIELRNLIANASFSIISSRWYENCPMSVLESFAFGKPVIGTNIGGIPELIHDGTDGLLYEMNDHEDLADKLKKMWQLKTKRSEMGIEGRNKVEEYFNPNRHYDELISIYRDLVN